MWSALVDHEVAERARLWKDAVTLSEKEKLASEHGIRWTPLHELPFWRPVKNVLLGLMHNWLEGILQAQLRNYFGIGRTKEQQESINKQVHDDVNTYYFPPDDDDEDETGLAEQEVDSSADELDGVFLCPSSGSD